MTTKRRVMGPTFEPDPEPVMEGPPRPPRPSSPSSSVVEGPSRSPSHSPSSMEGPVRPPSSSTTERPAHSQRRRVMGPTLDDDDTSSSSSSASSSSLPEGPAPPPQRRRVMGPTLDDDESPSSSSSLPSEGPAPPQTTQRRRVMGPTLDDDESTSSSSLPFEGPAPPPGYSKPTSTPSSSHPPRSPEKQGKKRELDRGPIVGPVIGPPRPNTDASQAQDDEEDEEVERRLRASEWDSVKRENTTKVVQRESWMTELPPERSANPTALITARQFSRKDNVTGRGDTSLWTDSPADKERKKQKVQDSKNLKEVATQHFANQKDEANKKIIEEYNKKFRAKSLAEEHQENLKKKQAEAKPEDEPTWRPFDRERDLEGRMADPKTAAKLIKDSHNLNNRFGSSSKRFL